MLAEARHLTRACIHLDRLDHNLRLLQELAGERPLWPAIKANAYGHGLEIIARELVMLGCDTLCVAHVTEAVELVEAGIPARLLLLSATLPEHSEAIVRHRCEPVVCDLRMLEALGRTAARLAMPVAVHLAVDTGRGRIGLQPSQVSAFLARCRDFASVQVRGLMSHFPCADMADKTLSNSQIHSFNGVIDAARTYAVGACHMANSAAIFDLPNAYYDAVRPGISIYGLRPSWEIGNPLVEELKPVLEWKTRVSFLKEVPAGTGLSYGHAWHAPTPALTSEKLERPLRPGDLPAALGIVASIRLARALGYLRGLCASLGRGPEEV